MLKRILQLKNLFSQNPQENNAKKLIFLSMTLSFTRHSKTLHTYKVERSKQSPNSKTISGWSIVQTTTWITNK